MDSNPIFSSLKSLAALPLTRKVAIALLYALLAWLNSYLAIGISDGAMQGFAGVLAAAILGIALEDGAKKKALADVEGIVDAGIKRIIGAPPDDPSKEDPK